MSPRTVGPYTVLRALGEGGMGSVYLGRDRGGALAAIKVIRADLAGDEEFRARFRQEVDAASRVRGPYTAAVLGAQVDGPAPWLATEYVPAPSLRSAVHDHGPMPTEAARLLGIGLAEALAAIHAVGVVHRDLKPGNVLLAVEGPKVIDFGIARAADAAQLTRTGSLVGTPGYIAPEQLLHERAGPPADVFALGGVLLYALTARPPFGDGEAPALLYRVMHVDPDLRAVPAALAPVVGACLDRDPARRPTPAGVRDALAAAGAADRPAAGWLPGAITAPEPPPPPPRRTRPLLAAAAAVVLLAAVAAGVWALRPDANAPGGTAASGTAGPNPFVPASTSPGPATSTPATAAPAGPVTEFSGLTGFTSPSGNIGCLVDVDVARCDIRDRAWGDTTPTTPADCPLAYGDALSVEGAGRGGFVCHGDTVLSAGPALPYGESVRVGTFLCTSRESGVECRNEATRHGFTIARAGYQIF